MFHNMGSCPSRLLSPPDGNVTSVLNICPCGSGGIKDFKNAGAQSKPVWNWSGALHRCLCEQPQRGDYTGSPPFWPVGEMDSSSSWPQCIICAVRSVSWFVFSTLKPSFQTLCCFSETTRWNVSTLLCAYLHWAASVWPNMSAVVLLPLHYQISANDTFTQSNKSSCFLIRVQRALVSNRDGQ